MNEKGIVGPGPGGGRGGGGVGGGGRDFPSHTPGCWFAGGGGAPPLPLWRAPADR